MKYVVMLIPEGRLIRAFAKLQDAADYVAYLTKRTLEESGLGTGYAISQTYRIAELEL